MIPISTNFKVLTNLPIDSRFVFNTIGDRDALNPTYRYEGLIAYGIFEETNWQLVGGIENSNWVELGNYSNTSLSSSWASSSLSASYVPNLYPQTYQASASWASQSLSSSYAKTASVARSSSIGTVYDNSTYPFVFALDGYGNSPLAVNGGGGTTILGWNPYLNVLNVTEVQFAGGVNGITIQDGYGAIMRINAGGFGGLKDTIAFSNSNGDNIYFSGSQIISASLQGTASYANKALSASYSPVQLPDITDDTVNHFIGINNLTPQSALDVDGNILLTGYLINTGSVPPYSNFVGINAGWDATNAYNSNFFGTFAGNEATNANGSNFFGFQAGNEATNANGSNFFGLQAGNGATYANDSNFFGVYAGGSATSASYSNFFGLQSGYGATNANNSIFIGYFAGLNDTVNNSGSKSSILIGDYTSTGGNSDSIAIGKGTMNSVANQLNIGNVIYSTGIDSGSTPSSTPIAGGKVGIGINAPVNTLDVAGNISCSVITASLFNGTASITNAVFPSYGRRIYVDTFGSKSVISGSI